MALTESLDPVEARILGVLVEKEFTTPEGYPLSLNALVNGCNQKSNRDPTVSYTEQTVNEALLRLRMHRIVREMHTAGARVVKFAHSARDVLEVDDKELAVLAELLLRGGQTHGELRGRVKRMTPVESLAELAVILSKLQSRGMTCSLPPVAGSRAGRVGHLLGDHRSAAGTPAATAPPRDEPADVESGPIATIHVAAPSPAIAAGAPTAHAPAQDAGHSALESRVAALEAQVERLTGRLDALDAD